MPQPYNVRHPFGLASIQTIADAAAMPVTIANGVTFLNIDTMAQDSTLNLTIDPDLLAGALLYVKVASDATARALVPGTGITGTSVAGTISKTKLIQYVYDGSTFKHVSTTQLD